MARKGMKEHEKILVHLFSGETVTVAYLKERLPSDFNWKELYKYVARIKLRAGGIVAMTKVGKEIMALQLTNPEKFKVGQTGPRWSEAFTKLIYGEELQNNVPIVALKPVKEKKIKLEKPVKVKAEKPIKEKKIKVKKAKVEVVEDVVSDEIAVSDTVAVSDEIAVSDTTKSSDYGSRVMEQIRKELEASKKEDRPVVKAALRKKTPMEWAIENKNSPRSINEAPPAEPIDWDNIKWKKSSLAVDKDFDNVDISDLVGKSASVVE